MENRYRLLIETDDQKGLIHTVSGILLQHGLNIEQNSEFVEKESNRFFMRTEVSGVVSEGAALVDELQSTLGQSAQIRLQRQRKKRVVILVTKEHHCIGDLLLRHRYNEMEFEIAAVVGNYDHLADLVEGFGIAYHHVSHEGHTRESHEAALVAAIAPYEPEYLVLAKYMRILTPDFVARYENRIINIHHSFLPAFIGANPYRQAYDRGVKIIGATAHFVTNDLDEGPIIAQSILPVDHTHSAVEMARAGKDVEKQVLSKALRLVFDDRVFIHGNRTIIFE